MFPKSNGKQSRNKKAQSCSTLWFDECYEEYYRNSAEREQFDAENENSTIVNHFDKKDEHTIRIEIKYDDEDNENENEIIQKQQTPIESTHEDSNDVNDLAIFCQDYTKSKFSNGGFEIPNGNVYLARRQSANRVNSERHTSSLGQPRNSTYNEKPIDVPDGFEEAAYARAIRHNRSPLRRKIRTPTRHLNPTLSEFLQVRNYYSRFLIKMPRSNAI